MAAASSHSSSASSSGTQSPGTHASGVQHSGGSVNGSEASALQREDGQGQEQGRSDRQQFQRQLTIRPATPGDRKRLHQIQLDAIRTLCATDYSENELNAILQSKQRPPMILRQVLVAEHDGQVIGFGSLGWRRRSIDALFVDPGYVRLGVASRLCRSLEEEATASGVRKLGVMASLTGVAFYESAGFEQVAPQDIQVDWSQTGTVPCVQMCKTLAGEDSEPPTTGRFIGNRTLDPAALHFWAFAFAGLFGAFLIKHLAES